MKAFTKTFRWGGCYYCPNSGAYILAGWDRLLYIVATPIGNMEDITLRALRVLRDVPLIAAEDTRKTRGLLERHGIKTRLTSFHDHSGEAKLSQLVDHMMSDDLALVSDAGMPSINDPGHELIAAAIENSVPVVPIPGATAVITALVASGLPTSQFTFVGFLHRKSSERRKLLSSVIGEGRTTVAFETPHRIHAALDDIAAVAPDVEIAVCRELTKLHEEVFRGSPSEARAHFTNPRGEFTLVIGPRTQPTTSINDAELRSAFERLDSEGVSGREAVDRVAQEYGVGRNRVYRVWVGRERENC